jgi:hypothetical protein
VCDSAAAILIVLDIIITVVAMFMVNDEKPVMIAG